MVKQPSLIHKLKRRSQRHLLSEFANINIIIRNGFRKSTFKVAVILKSSCQGDKSIEFRTEDNISSNTPAICQTISDKNAKA